MKEAAAAFGKKHSIEVEVTAGPTPQWINHAKADADLIFSGSEVMMSERVAALKAGRDKAAEALDYARKSSATPIEIDPIAIDRFTRLMRDQLTSGDVAARKAYLRAW